MSHLMDPDGTNRVVQQRIREWHRELEGERNARLLEVDGSDTRRMLSSVADRITAQARRLVTALRRAVAQQQGVVSGPAVDVKPVVEGPRSP
jgi:hypothetical protein